MAKKLKKETIFTIFDEDLQKTFKTDAMGMQVVWTYFGQKIFNNKITSVALDIRSYNINLFNHFLIKNLMMSDIEEFKRYFEKNRREGIEKLLILLENMLIWSWFNSKKKYVANGLLGTSKALSSWKNSQINLNLNQSITSLQLLENQKSLGVNGRYKGPFIQMGFFNSSYYADYLEDEYENIENLVKDTEELSELFKSLMIFFENDNRTVSEIPCSSFTKAFGKVERLSKKTKTFWLKKLGFNSLDAMIVYNNVNLKNEKQKVQEIFLQENQNRKSNIFNEIIELEPYLSYAEKLFSYILLNDGTKLQNLENEKYFNILSNFNFNKFSAKGSAFERLNELNKIIDVTTLITYHTEIMKIRGHEPWVKIIDNIIKVDVQTQENLVDVIKVLDAGVDSIDWAHDYYTRSVRNIKKGLES